MNILLFFLLFPATKYVVSTSVYYTKENNSERHTNVGSLQFPSYNPVSLNNYIVSTIKESVVNNI